MDSAWAHQALVVYVTQMQESGLHLDIFQWWPIVEIVRFLLVASLAAWHLLQGLLTFCA